MWIKSYHSCTNKPFIIPQVTDNKPVILGCFNYCIFLKIGFEVWLCCVQKKHLPASNSDFVQILKANFNGCLFLPTFAFFFMLEGQQNYDHHHLLRSHLTENSLLWSFCLKYLCARDICARLNCMLDSVLQTPSRLLKQRKLSWQGIELFRSTWPSRELLPTEHK